ncbi:MAG TPA: magnesium transporter [Solirubrobacterales bacterium]|nr:magnesium transporter [Solirubrobacterales bacterium]
MAPTPGSAAAEVAAAHATIRIPTAAPGDRAGDVRTALAGCRFESAAAVAVLEGDVLIGLVALEGLLAAPAQSAVGDLCDPEPPIAGPATAEEHVARAMAHRGGESVAVVDDRGRFRGLVSAREMLPVVAAEHDEDLARLGGYLAGARRARGAAEESVARRLWHRVPWLLLGLVGAMGTALIIGGFEHQLDSNLLLAFFIPAVVYMADAVGTQTETVLIRALSVGVSVRTMLARELITGVLMGAVVGAAFAAFALAGWGEPRVAVAVGIALLASCSLATFVAMLLPALLQRLGRDPAFGSGPLATVVQDLLSIVVYFALAAAIVG